MSEHPTLEQARAAKAEALRTLKGLTAVVGVGITRVQGAYALKVNLRAPLGAGRRLPEFVNGVRIHVEVVGQPRKQ